MKVTDKYVFFYNDPFSQHFISPMKIGNVEYNCCEQYMMHKKALLFGDFEIANEIMLASNPNDQKELGRKVKNFNLFEWDILSKRIVYIANYHKFTQNYILQQKLLETVDKLLVEASPIDKIWGIGLSEDDPDILDKNKWKGSNLLGEILTLVKYDIKNLKS